MKHFGIYNSTRFIKKISSVSIAVLISTLTISDAKAEEDYLLRVDMSMGLTWDSSQAVPKIAKLKQLRYRIPQINPDLLVAQVVMDYPLENASSVLDSKWNLGIWIYGPSINCLNQDSCTSILIVRPSYNQKSSIEILKKLSDTAPTISDCPSNYAVSKNENNDSTISFSMSISCLGITSSFATYVFSGYDIGLTEMPYQFTRPTYLDNPYSQLAKQSYDKNGGKEGLGKLGKSESMTKLESTIGKARSSFDDLTYRYQELAPQIQAKIDKNKEWKNFLLMDEQLVEIESKIENNSLTDSQIPNEVSRVIKIINSQISGLKVIVKLIPTYQCYNEEEELRTVLSKSKTCPKGYKKVKT
jgi:hypothetical protein